MLLVCPVSQVTWTCIITLGCIVLAQLLEAFAQQRGLIYQAPSPTRICHLPTPFGCRTGCRGAPWHHVSVLHSAVGREETPQVADRSAGNMGAVLQLYVWELCCSCVHVL